MNYGKQIFVVRKLKTNEVAGNIVTEEFDIKDIVDSTHGYWWNKDASKIEINGSDIYLVLCFVKNSQQEQKPVDINEFFPPRR